MTPFATVVELAAWRNVDTDPDDADVLLARASRTVAAAVRRRVELDSTTGLAVDDGYREALRDATTAQVEQWLADGDAGLCAVNVCDRSLLILKAAGLTGGPVAVV